MLTSLIMSLLLTGTTENTESFDSGEFKTFETMNYSVIDAKKRTIRIDAKKRTVRIDAKKRTVRIDAKKRTVRI